MNLFRGGEFYCRLAESNVPLRTLSGLSVGKLLNVSFPVSEFNGEQKATWYLSAATKQGDEFFTDLQKSGR